MSNSVIFGCWIIFLGYWFISARRVKAVTEKQSRAARLAYRIPEGLGWLLMVDWKLPPPMNRALTSPTDWALVTGAIVCVLGLFVTIWARVILAGNWSSAVTLKQGHELIKTGPYRFVRHPMHTGFLAMCLGTAIHFGLLRLWLSVLVVGIGFWIKLRQEERLLLRHFPDEYPAYQKQVKALVPFVI